MQEWRKKRDGNTGMAMNGGRSRASEAAYEESDISRAVELAVAQHAEEGLFHRLVEVHELDAVGLHAAVGERARAVVVPAGEA